MERLSDPFNRHRRQAVCTLRATALIVGLCLIAGSNTRIRAQQSSMPRGRDPLAPTTEPEPTYTPAPPVGGAWTQLAHLPPVSVTNCLLLTDGTVMCQQYGSRSWRRLTPDSSGSYLNGTWSTLASMQVGYAPLYFASAVLSDGRVIVEGGEYDCTSGCTANWQNKGSMYDPVTNTWTAVSPPSGWTTIGDAQSVVLADGRFMLGDCCSGNNAFLNAATLTWTAVTGNQIDNYNNEEGYTLLPDGRVLTVDAWPANSQLSECFTPATQTWVSCGDTQVLLTDNNRGASSSYEQGPGVLRADGTVLYFGAALGAAHTSVFNPSTNSWTPGSDFPMGDGSADGPAALLPNGNVLVQGSPGIFGPTSHWYEVSGTTFTQVASPAVSSYSNFQGGMLVLPTGQVLQTRQSTDVQIYTPTGTYDPAWAPTITTAPSSVAQGGTYLISGKQFNGLSQAGMYGDDLQAATNYPIVRITNRATGHVFYAKTHDHSTMAVATGNAIVSTSFDVPSNTESGSSDIEVVANGIPSAKSAVNVYVPALLSISKSHTGNFAQGQVGATYTIGITNIGLGSTTGTVTVSDTAPTGLTITGMSGTGWTCTTTCQRSDTLMPGLSYPSITVTVNVAGNAPSSVTNSATVSGGGDPNQHTANDPTTITLPPDLTITKSHTGTFRQGQTGATYTITVSNLGPGPTNSLVTVTDTVPAGLTATGLSGTGWTCPTLTSCNRSDVLTSGNSYPAITLTVSVAVTAPSTVTNTATVSGGADSSAGNNTANDVTTILLAQRFISVSPCRVADTRNPNGPLGGPSLAAGVGRTFSVPSSACGIPSTAKAYSLNATVVPHGFLDYLTLWPTGATRPFISTLNAYDGQVAANATIVPAGTGGAIDAFATNETDLILDINGYFLDTTSPTALMFYPLTPCRVSDTRSPNGPLGGPILTGGATRSFPILSSSCGIPMTAQAYVLNATVVPPAFLDYLTLWPTGIAQPFVSTLNGYDGQVTANMAIVPAGTGGAINAFVTQDTHLVLDVTGYFAPPATGGLSLFTLPPCRVADTRLPNGPLGGPIMNTGTSRSFPVLSSTCGAAAAAQAYVMHATVVPSGSLQYITVWPTGVAQPLVSTLNALDGQVTSNSVVAPSGTAGAISVFTTDTTHVILDINGFFAP